MKTSPVVGSIAPKSLCAALSMVLNPKFKSMAAQTSAKLEESFENYRGPFFDCVITNDEKEKVVKVEQFTGQELTEKQIKINLQSLLLEKVGGESFVAGLKEHLESQPQEIIRAISAGDKDRFIKLMEKRLGWDFGKLEQKFGFVFSSNIWQKHVLSRGNISINYAREHGINQDQQREIIKNIFSAFNKALNKLRPNNEIEKIIVLLLAIGFDCQVIIKVNMVINDEEILDTTPINFVIERKYNEMFELMIKNGANVNYADSSGNSAIHIAVLMADLEMIQTLINHGAHVNSANKYGRSAIHTLVRENYLELINEKIKILLSAGANINVQDKNLDTPLHDAVKENGPEVVRALLNNGADVNVVNCEQMTPVYGACVLDRDNAEMAKLLFTGKNFRIDHRDLEFGETFLHYALHSKAINIAAAILDFAAENNVNLFNIKDNDGFTPLETAVYECSVPMVELLLARGANIESLSILGINSPDFDCPLIRHLENGEAYLKVQPLLQNHWRGKVGLPEVVIDSVEKNKSAKKTKQKKSPSKFPLEESISSPNPARNVVYTLSPVTANQSELVATRIVKVKQNLANAITGIEIDVEKLSLVGEKKYINNFNQLVEKMLQLKASKDFLDEIVAIGKEFNRLVNENFKDVSGDDKNLFKILQINQYLLQQLNDVLKKSEEDLQDHPKLKELIEVVENEIGTKNILKKFYGKNFVVERSNKHETKSKKKITPPIEDAKKPVLVLKFKEGKINDENCADLEKQIGEAISAAMLDMCASFAVLRNTAHNDYQHHIDDIKSGREVRDSVYNNSLALKDALGVEMDQFLIDIIIAEMQKIFDETKSKSRSSGAHNAEKLLPPIIPNVISPLSEEGKQIYIRNLEEIFRIAQQIVEPENQVKASNVPTKLDQKQNKGRD